MPTLKLVWPNTEWLEHDGSGFEGQNPKGVLSDDITSRWNSHQEGRPSDVRALVHGPNDWALGSWCRRISARALAQRGCIHPCIPLQIHSFSGSSTHDLLHFFEYYILWYQKSLGASEINLAILKHDHCSVSTSHISVWLNKQISPEEQASQNGTVTVVMDRNQDTLLFFQRKIQIIPQRDYDSKYIGLNIIANDDSLRHGQDSPFPFHGLHGWADVCGCRRGHGYALGRTRPTCKWRWPPQSCAASSDSNLCKAILWSTAWWQS